MNLHDLFLEARKRGLQIVPAGGKLAVTPKGACAPEFAAVLREHKTELLAWLTRPPCPGWRSVPPDDLALNPLPPSPTPSTARLVVDYVVRQITGTDSLCSWCLRRELAYWTAYQWDDALCCYCASRDAACFQLGATEADLWLTLQSFAEVGAIVAKQDQAR